ncbi:TPA: hypothetical protein LUC71_002549 [Acinetobacter baumannii]|uniref:hypothetical protein n=1 Tax=Acinetobacter baumannii TaxID=470 RepID=UPI0013C7E6E9|nr:hypothetical protein [Acinetobacter baumannii]NDW25391.1 hypothetical protein [Acinetobacter baumannii]HBM1135807.1 hypothetical protein [Acinetobacter baumannii]
MTDLNKESEVNLRFEQDDGAVWVFADDSQFGTEISHLMMMHADEYNEDELRVICHNAACEIDRLRAELEKAKAQAVPETHLLVPKDKVRDLVTELEMAFEANLHLTISDLLPLQQDLKVILETSESGAEG